MTTTSCAYCGSEQTNQEPCPHCGAPFQKANQNVQSLPKLKSWATRLGSDGFERLFLFIYEDGVQIIINDMDIIASMAIVGIEDTGRYVRYRYPG